jgi:hypothetical protein
MVKKLTRMHPGEALREEFLWCGTALCAFRPPDSLKAYNLKYLI